MKKNAIAEFLEDNKSSTTQRIGFELPGLVDQMLIDTQAISTHNIITDKSIWFIVNRRMTFLGTFSGTKRIQYFFLKHFLNLFFDIIKNYI